MPAPIFLRSGLIGSAVAAIVAGPFGFASHSLGAALVGETRQISVERKPAAGIDAMKAQYRRPMLIPFPNENPFTLAKAALGKKLYFDPRLSAASVQSCASCHNPGYRTRRDPSRHFGDDARIQDPELREIEHRGPYMHDGSRCKGGDCGLAPLRF